MGKQKDFVALSILNMYHSKATACSIGIVKVKNGRVVDEYHSLISPPPELASKAFILPKDVHGISEEQTDGKPTFIELLPSVEEFIEGLPIVVYNGVVERFTFIRAMEFYRSKGMDVQTYLENVHYIDVYKMTDKSLFGKNYDTLHDARLYAEFYQDLDVDDVLYPAVKEKKRPDITHEYMTGVKSKEKVSPEVYESFDLSLVNYPNNPYFGFGVFVTGETDCFSSKTELYLFLRNELGVRPRKSPAAGKDNILVVCSRGAGQGRIDTATKRMHIIISEEELFEDLKSQGFEVPEKQD